MMNRDEGHIQQIVKFTEDNMIDPFDVSSHPKDLSTLIVDWSLLQRLASRH